MPLTMADVTAALAADEPDYGAIATRLGSDAAPFLGELAAGADPMYAARAVSLASFLPAALAIPVVTRAVAHPQPAVRVAAAAALGALGDAAGGARGPASILLTDADAGVRAWTLRSLERTGVGALRAQVATLAGSDPVPELRAHAARLSSGG